MTGPLPLGSDVPVTVSMLINANSILVGQAEGSLFARLFIDFDEAFEFSGSSGTTFVQTRILQVGDSIEIEGELSVFAASGPPDPDTGAPSSADVDVGDTVRVFLDPLIPGVHIVDADGHDFPTSPSASATPEPSTAILMCSGLGLLGAAGAIARLRSAVRYKVKHIRPTKPAAVASAPGAASVQVWQITSR